MTFLITRFDTYGYYQIIAIPCGIFVDYFVYNINQNLISAKIYTKIKTKFDTKVNKAQYHINWSLITYSTFKIEKNNIEKTIMKVLLALLDKL